MKELGFLASEGSSRVPWAAGGILASWHISEILRVDLFHTNISIASLTGFRELSDQLSLCHCIFGLHFLAPCSPVAIERDLGHKDLSKNKNALGFIVKARNLKCGDTGHCLMATVRRDACGS